MKIPSLKSILLLVPLAIFLGIAPLGSEPHLVGKWRWIMGGAKGMAFVDWFDFFLHLFPTIALVILLTLWAKKRFSQQASQ